MRYRVAAIFAGFAAIAVCVGWAYSYRFEVSAGYDRVEAKGDRLAAKKLVLASCGGGIVLAANVGSRFTTPDEARMEVLSHDRWYPNRFTIQRASYAKELRADQYFIMPNSPHPLGFQLVWQSQKVRTQSKNYEHGSYAVSIPYWFLLACSIAAVVITLRRLQRAGHANGFETISNANTRRSSDQPRSGGRM